MELKEEMDETMNQSKLIENGEYFFSASISEVTNFLKDSHVDMIIAHIESYDLQHLIELIKDEKIRLIIVGTESQVQGVTIMSGERISSWHESIPYENVN